MGSINVGNYADDVRFIHRDNEKKIIDGCLRNWVKKIYSGCCQCFCS